MEVKVVSGIIKKVEHLTKTPEKYLSVQEDAALEIRQLTKELYDLNKKKEVDTIKNSDTLDELILENLDEEQIWQQIELQNNFIRQEFVQGIAQFLAKKKDFESGDKAAVDAVDTDGESEDDISDEGSDKEEIVSEGGSLSDGDESEGKDDGFKSKKKSIVDDKFFKLSEMESFLKREETKKGGAKDEDDDEDEDEIIDYFENMSSDSGDENERFKYDDFFDQPDDATGKRKRKREKGGKSDFEDPKKKVKFAVDSDAEEEGEDESDGFDDESNEEAKDKSSGIMSTFEARQERLKNRIKALEEEALSEKPWQLKGEITASGRPQNSLLEEYVEFDTAARPAPVMTEKSTLKLEDIIKQRIKDKAWDDVERKIKPVENPKEYKKRLVLDQEKSKLSLAQIYEQEYLKQKEAKSENPEDKPEEVPGEHVEIDKMLKKLFLKLDALSNLHFTPNMASTEVKIISNLPAIMVEEVAPVATSDAALLAPEEVKSKMKGDLIGKSERTKTDKKRERRIKKKKQGMKQKEIEKKEKRKVEKVKGFGKKSKKVPKKLAKKLGRSTNVSQMTPSGDGKYTRTSNAFFSKLQDEVKTHIKKKGGDSKKLQDDNNKKLDVKKLKL